MATDPPLTALYMGRNLVLRRAVAVSQDEVDYVTGKHVIDYFSRRLSGTIIPFVGLMPPERTLYCNGQEFYDTDFVLLSSRLKATSNDFIVSSTKFRVPDLRGLFLRGWDDSRGHDPGRYAYSVQWHEIASHNHFINKPMVQIDNNTGAMKGLQSGGYWGDQKIAINALGTDSAGGNETRPINYSVKYAIIY